MLKKFLVLNPTKRASLEVREPEIHIPDLHLDGAEWKGRGDGEWVGEEGQEGVVGEGWEENGQGRKTGREGEEKSKSPEGRESVICSFEFSPS